MTEDNRKSIRRYTCESFLLFNSDTNELIGRVLNLSPDGMLIAGDQEIAADATVPCRLDFAHWHELHRHLKFRATSRWCKRNLHLDWYESGWSILDLSDADRQIIEDMTRDWKTMDSSEVRP